MMNSEFFEQSVFIRTEFLTCTHPLDAMSQSKEFWCVSSYSAIFASVLGDWDKKAQGMRTSGNRAIASSFDYHPQFHFLI